MYFNMTGSSQRNTEVSVTFRHALSWIDVILVKDADTSEEAFITVNSVTFKNILPTGDATVDNSAINGANTIQWGAKGAAADVVVTEAEGHLLVPENTTPLEKQPLFIPQAMTKMIVNYTIASRDGSNFTETKEVELAGLTPGQSKWLPGKKYTYTITIGTTEVLIDPEVTEWNPVPVNVPI